MLKTTVEAPSTTVIGRRRITLMGFFLLTFAFSWPGAIPMIVASWQGGSLPAGLEYLQLLLFFGAAISTILVVWWNEGRGGISRLLKPLLIWRTGIQWYLFVLFAPAACYGLALLLSRWVGSPTPPLLPLPALLGAFGTIFLGYLLLNTEELAWRGYALPQLLRTNPPWRASLLLGLLWARFHAPIFLLKGGHSAGYDFGWYALMIVGLNFIFTWLFLNSKGSLL